MVYIQWAGSRASLKLPPPGHAHMVHCFTARHSFFLQWTSLDTITKASIALFTHGRIAVKGNSFPEYILTILYILDYQWMSMLFLTYSMHQLVSVPHSMHSLSQLGPLKPSAQSHMQVTGFRVPPFWHTRLQAGRDTEQRKLRTDPFLLLTSIHVSTSNSTK